VAGLSQPRPHAGRSGARRDHRGGGTQRRRQDQPPGGDALPVLARESARERERPPRAIRRGRRVRPGGVRDARRPCARGGGAPPELDAWDEQLIQTGAAVIRARAESVDAIAQPASQAFSEVSGYDLVVRYAPNVPADDVEAGFRQRLDERRSDELQRRTSLV